MKSEAEIWRDERARVASGAKPRSSWWLVGLALLLVVVAVGVLGL